MLSTLVVSPKSNNRTTERSTYCMYLVVLVVGVGIAALRVISIGVLPTTSKISLVVDPFTLLANLTLVTAICTLLGRRILPTSYNFR